MTFAHSRRLDADRSPTDHPLRSRDVIVEFLPRHSSFVPRLLSLLFLSPLSLSPLSAPPIRLDAKTGDKNDRLHRGRLINGRTVEFFAIEPPPPPPPFSSLREKMKRRRRRRRSGDGGGTKREDGRNGRTGSALCVQAGRRGRRGARAWEVKYERCRRPTAISILPV